MPDRKSKFPDRHWVNKYPQIIGGFDDTQQGTWLGINNNQIIALPPCIFNGLENLTYLHLSHNQITALPPGVFNGLGNLVDLSLYKTPIQFIYKKIKNSNYELVPPEIAIYSRKLYVEQLFAKITTISNIYLKNIF